MAKRQPDSRLVPEGKVIKDEYAENYQFSAHISQYHKEWLDAKREDVNGFSASKRLRELLDLMILKDEVDIPEECFIHPDDKENTALEGIEVFSK